MFYLRQRLCFSLDSDNDIQELTAISISFISFL